MPLLGTLRVLVPLVLALAGPAVPDDPQAHPLVVPPVRLVEDDGFVEMRLDGVALADVLDAAQPILGLPLQSDPSDVAHVFVSARGTQRVPRAAFRDAFDALLRRYEFWTWDDTSGAGTVIDVFKVNEETRYGAYRLPFTPPVLTPEELAAGPLVRSPVYTTSFALTHVPAIDLLTVVQSMLDPIVGKARPIEASNQLLVTASRDRLLAVRAALNQLDVPGPQSPGAGLWGSALEQRLAELEKRLAVVESKPDR